MSTEQQQTIDSGDGPGVYRLFGLRPSFYTRKVAGMLASMQLPHEDLLKSADRASEIEAAVGGYKKFPVIQTPQGAWITDSTDIGLHLNAAHADCAILPEDGAMRALALMLDDWIDEWLLRPTLYWRVNDIDNQRWVARQATANLNGQAEAVAAPPDEKDDPAVSMAMRFFAGAGEINRAGAEHEEEVLGILTRAADALTLHFEKRPFFLGTRVSLPDFALYGMLEAGLLWEPAARAVVEKSWPSLETFRVRMRDAVAGSGEFDAPEDVPETLATILEIAGSDYGDFLMANAAAIAGGEETASWGTAGMRARHFTEKCRKQTNDALDLLNDDQKRQLSRMGADRIVAAYWAGGLR